jgi:transcriptional regulator with XRE-family HTH domain
MKYSIGISQETAAMAAGCTAGSIGNYENGKMGISEERLKKLLACYGFSYADFVDYMNGKPSPLVSVK